MARAAFSSSDCSLDEQACPECPDHLSAEPGLRPDLRLHGKPSVPKTNRHRRSMHRFQKALPKFPVDLKKHPNNYPATSAFICVHLRVFTAPSTRPLTNLTHQTAKRAQLHRSVARYCARFSMSSSDSVLATAVMLPASLVRLRSLKS